MANEAGNREQGTGNGSELPAPEPAEAGVSMSSPGIHPGVTEDKEIATKEDLPLIPAPDEPVEPTLLQSSNVDQTIQTKDAPRWDTIKEQPAPDTLKEQPAPEPEGSAAPDTMKERAAPSSESAPEAALPSTNNETKEQAAPTPQDEQAPRPKRPAQLETALTATALVLAASIATWMLARPATLLFPPTQEQAAQMGQSPDCRRVRFDVEQLLGERWRQIIASCLRGSCDGLRETLLVRNFPVSTWQLIEADDSGQGCEVNAQGAAKSPECTRLAGRIEGVAKTVLLQVEGECREKL